MEARSTRSIDSMRDRAKQAALLGTDRPHALGTGLAGRHRSGAALAIGAVAGVAVVELACARALSRPRSVPVAHYSRRSGWPLPPAEMRGAALEDFMPPRDMRIPESLRPWANANSAADRTAF